MLWKAGVTGFYSGHCHLTSVGMPGYDSHPLLPVNYLCLSGVETPLVVTAGGSAPAYTHITTIPVQLLQKEAEKEAVPVYMSIFSQMVQSAGLDESEEGTSPQAAQAPFDGLCEAFYLVMQSPSSFCMTSQVCPVPMLITLAHHLCLRSGNW